MFWGGGILWLDLGGGFGWAYGHAGDEPITGAYDLPPADRVGERAGRFENALLELFGDFRPRFVGVEAHMAAKAQKSEAAAVSAIGLWVMTAAACWRNDLPCVPRSVSTVRCAVIGRDRLTPEEKAAKLTVKEAIVEPWIKGMGWRVFNHNARDAAVGWAFETGIRARKP